MENLAFAEEPQENTQKTKVLYRSELKSSENSGFAKEHILNNGKHWFRVNLWKTSRKHWFCLGAYGQRKEHIGFTQDPIENARKTQVLSGNLLET